LKIPHELSGATLLDALTELLPRAHRAALRGELRAGRIRLNRLAATAGTRVQEADLVELDRKPAELRSFAPPAQAAGPVVLFENDALLVVDKPSGLPTVPDRSGREPGLHGLLAELRPGADLRIVHRLDRGTSGCLLLAKGIEAARALDRAFRAQAIQKSYLALVDGVVGPDRWTSRAPLGPDRARPGLVRVVAENAKGARAAETSFTVVERFARHTLLRASPKTGRSHQIRVHAQAAGHPIAGDPDYGGETLRLSALKPRYKARPGVAEKPLLARMFLHAETIELEDPAGGGTLRIEAPLPDELLHLLARLRRLRGGRRR
jgi:23S rRNA pseudouridine955/2504/2580 synthase